MCNISGTTRDTAPLAPQVRVRTHRLHLIEAHITPAALIESASAGTVPHKPLILPPTANNLPFSPSATYGKVVTEPILQVPQEQLPLMGRCKFSNCRPMTFS